LQDKAHSKNKTHKDEKGDKAQSPVRGVLPGHNPTELHTIDTHMPAVITQQTDNVYGAHWATADLEQKMSVGDEETSPLREVPTESALEPEVTTDESISHRASVEEVEDEDNPRRREEKTEEKMVETKAERLEQQQKANGGEQEH